MHVQSAHPMQLVHNADMCPKLAAKFPRPYRVDELCADGPAEDAMTDNSTDGESVGKSVPCTATTPPYQGVQTAAAACYVQKARRKFRFPVRDAAIGSRCDALGIQSTTGASCSAATGAVCVNADSSSPVRHRESERSHCREGDLRSDL